MKFAQALLALTAVTSARNINLEDITAYGYLTKIGQPSLERIRKAEEEEDIQSRIVGGSVSSLGQFPYQAGLIITFGHGQAVCGGSLVNNRRVITAAHCWFDGTNQAVEFTIVLGSIRLYFGGTRTTSRKVIMHGSWNPSLIRNDIAIIYLLSDVATSDLIAPIALPSGSQVYDDLAGRTAIASGFGFTRDGDSIGLNQFLSHVNVQIITNNACRMFFHMFIQSSNICISGAGGRSTCHGDSGGPLVVFMNNKPTLCGVTSFGSTRGCEAGSPAAFARVTSYIGWINGHL